MIHHSLPPIINRRFESIVPEENRQKIREEISDHVSSFLKKGGKIESIGTVKRAVEKPRSIVQVINDRGLTLHNHVKGVKDIQIKYCKIENKYVVYVMGDFVGRYDGQHKANQMAVKSYNQRMSNKK